MSNIFELTTQLQILAAGRRPQWVIQAVTAALASAFVNAAPTSAADGVYLSQALKCLIGLSPRELTHQRSARAVITYDGATTYTVTVAGHAVATVGNTDIATTIADMVTNITADVAPGAGDFVTATAIDADGDGVVDTLLLRGKAEADWTLDATVAAGAGTIVATADPRDISVRIWGIPRNDAANNGPGWDLVNNGDLGTINYRGITDSLDAAGYDRFFFEIYGMSAVAGDGAAVLYTAKLRAGPAILE